MRNPLSSLSPAELEQRLKLAREWYFSRASLQGAFNALPRLAEVFDSMAARLTEEKAAKICHAVVVHHNIGGMANAFCRLTGAPGSVAEATTLGLLDFLFLASELDVNEFHAASRALSTDSMDLVKEILKKSD